MLLFYSDLNKYSYFSQKQKYNGCDSDYTVAAVKYSAVTGQKLAKVFYVILPLYNRTDKVADFRYNGAYQTKYKQPYKA